MQDTETAPAEDHPADSNETPSIGASIAGKAVILSMLLVTLGMAGFAVWYRQATTRRARERFGIEHAQRIQLATAIHLIQLDSPQASVDLTSIPNAEDPGWKLVSKVSGMTHVQGAMMEDRSFSWDAPEEYSPNWDYVLRFRDGSGGLTHIALDLTNTRLKLVEKGDELSFLPMATFLRRFVNSQYPPLYDSKRAAPSQSGTNGGKAGE